MPENEHEMSHESYSVPQNFIPGMLTPQIPYSNKHHGKNTNYLNPEKIRKTKALKSFTPFEGSKVTNRSKVAHLQFDKSTILEKFLRDKETFGSETPDTPYSDSTPTIICDDIDTSDEEIEKKRKFTFDEIDIDRPSSLSSNDATDRLVAISKNYSASTTDVHDIERSSFRERERSGSLTSLLDDTDIPIPNVDDKKAADVKVPLRKVSRSLTELRYFPDEVGRSRKISRKVSRFKKHLTYGSIKNTLSQEKLRLQKEREMLDEVQNQLRSKLPKTFQVTASLGINPQLLGQRRNTDALLVKPRQRRSRGPSMPAIFKKSTNDDSGDENTWKDKVMEKFKSTKKLNNNNNNNVKVKIKSEDKKGLHLPTRIKSSKKSTDSSGNKENHHSNKKTLEHAKSCSPKLRFRIRGKGKAHSESERDSTSSADSGIVMRNTDSPNNEEQMTSSKPKAERKCSSTIVFLSKQPQHQAQSTSTTKPSNTAMGRKRSNVRKISLININLTANNTLGSVQEDTNVNKSITSDEVNTSNKCIDPLLQSEDNYRQTSTNQQPASCTSISETEELLDEDTLKEIEDHLKEIDLVFDITS